MRKVAWGVAVAVAVAGLAMGGLAAAGAGAQTRSQGSGVTAGGLYGDSSSVHDASTRGGRGGVSTGLAGGLNVNGNGQTRSLDCRGGVLSVNGNRNRVTARNCSRATVQGSGNTVRVGFVGRASLAVPGSRNTVSWHAARGVRVATYVMGKRNNVTRR